MTTLATLSGLEIPLPPPGLRLMNDDDERFTSQGVQLAQLCYRLGLRDDHEILDVGCSVGRLAIGLLMDTEFQGRYVGFDVMRRQVRWSSRNLGAVAPRFHFRHADVRNARYNPTGAVDPEDFRFPRAQQRLPLRGSVQRVHALLRRRHPALPQ